jgi:serine/threonine protein phosphatase PrpC
MSGIRQMIKLIEALRKRRLQMQQDASSTKREIWNPVSREAPGRKLSAPSHRLCAATDIGKRRSRNEDEYYLSPDCRLWIVADGMGGHAAGDVASALTIQAIAESMHPSGPNAFSGAEAAIGDRLVEAFTAAQNRVSNRSLSEPECNGMGSTVIAGFVDGEDLYVCHVGDVRGYHFSEGQLTRLTNDHSLVWELVTSGQLTPDQARLHPQRSKVTQAIGMLAGIAPEVTSRMLKPRDRVLLCSDGLWEALPEPYIGEIVGADGPVMESLSMLVDKANATSGQDNITAVLYEHSGSERTASRIG